MSSYLDWQYNKPTVAHVAYERLAPELAKVGVESFVQLADHDVTGTGGVFVVFIESKSGWATDSYHSGIRHPILIVNVYADDTRDTEGRAIAHDAHSRALATYEFIDSRLNRATAKTWPAVVQCHRQEEPELFPAVWSESTGLDTSQGAVFMHARYEIAVLS